MSTADVTVWLNVCCRCCCLAEYLLQLLLFGMSAADVTVQCVLQILLFGLRSAADVTVWPNVCCRFHCLAQHLLQIVLLDTMSAADVAVWPRHIPVQ